MWIFCFALFIYLFLHLICTAVRRAGFGFCLNKDKATGRCQPLAWAQAPSSRLLTFVWLSLRLCVARQALQGKSGPVLFGCFFFFFFPCFTVWVDRLASLQVWYCTCVYSEMNPSCLFGGTFPEALAFLAASSPAF